MYTSHITGVVHVRAIGFYYLRVFWLQCPPFRLLSNECGVRLRSLVPEKRNLRLRPFSHILDFLNARPVATQATYSISSSLSDLSKAT